MNIKLKTHLFIFFLISVIPGINFGQKGTNYKKGLYANVGTIIKKNICIDCLCDGHINKYAEECSYNKKHIIQ
jgi:hypothetical protein